MLGTVEDYLAKVDIDKIMYINKIPLDKIVPKDIPVLNPHTSAYRKYWVGAEGEAQKCIEGFWVEHNKLWKFVPGVIYHYGAHWHILLSDKSGISKTKKKARPLIRDLEWIKGFIYLEARGFSGFADDDEYTCHREVSKSAEERTDEFIGKNCYNKAGNLKKYISAREYLWMYHTRNLGKALFENMAQNVVDLEARGTGKSYIMSNFAGVNWTFDGAQDFEEWWNSRKTDAQLASEVVIGAIDAKYVNDLTKKIKLGLESYTGKFTIGDKAYPAPFIKAYSGQWIPGQTVEQVVEVKKGGQWVKEGSRSKIQPRTFGDNEFAANGTRPGFSIIDEVGFMNNLLEVLVQMKECTADGADKFGTLWLTGTGGDMSGGSTQAVMDVFFDPKTYDCLEFDDVYENSGQKIGFFVPAWMGLNQFKDDMGNTNYKSAIQYLINARKKLTQGKDRSAYDGELSQRPILPSEVFLISGGNMLPTGMLKDQLSFLQTTPDKDYEGVLGRMSMDPTGKVSFNIDLKNELRACDWPVKVGEDHMGAVQIWEQPSPNVGFGYYLAGNDPYDINKAPNSPSLGSLIIMRRESPGISGEDRIVAEYTARPNTAVDFYEQCRLLLIYYGIVGTCLYENERVGIQTYFTNNNSAHLLARTPSILKANQTSNVNRGIGQHMSTKVKEECEIFLRDWLIAPAGNGKLNLHNIPSKPLLKELINYNKIGNFDRVIAMMLCIIQKTQMHKIVAVAAVAEAEADPFFSRSMFGGRVSGSNGFIGF
jgi:hypothetical protein